MKHIKFLPFILIIIFTFASCVNGYDRYSEVYRGHFDTNVTFIAFAEKAHIFNSASSAVRNVVETDGKLFDIYSNYEGINNLKTINDNAGIRPVEVDEAILDLLEFSIDMYELTNGTVNIAMGSVLRIWSEYREQGISLPPVELLNEHAAYTDINSIVIDRTQNTVFLKETGMSVDVGSIAKGFTAMRALDAAQSTGVESALINMGGDIAALGKPMDGRERWSVGIQNPFLDEERRNIMDTVYVNGMAIASSGNYERFYTVDGINYSHIIDPETLFPAVRFAHVTVVHKDAALAEAFSTALFIMSLSQGRELLEKNGAEGMWIMPDGTIETTPGYDAISQQQSGYSASDN
jgi:thiamine biosynthesis lipoprotein